MLEFEGTAIGVSKDLDPEFDAALGLADPEPSDGPFCFGSGDDELFCLERFLARPCVGVVDPDPNTGEYAIQWAQSMGKVVITSQLPETIDPTDLQVEMNRWQIKVTKSPPGGGKRLPVPALSKDLSSTVRSLNSFWTVQRQQDHNLIVIALTKQDHRSWKELWQPPAVGEVIFRRSPFTYNQNSYTTAGDDRWSVLPRDGPQWGTPEAPNIEKPYVCHPKKLCLNLHDVQAHGVDRLSVFLFFDQHHLKQLHSFVPLEEMLLTEVTARSIKVYLKFCVDGDDYIKVFEAHLTQDCLPSRTSWAIAWRRASSTVGVTGDFPTLRICLTLATEQDAGWHPSSLLGQVLHASSPELAVPEKVCGLATELDPTSASASAYGAASASASASAAAAASSSSSGALVAAG